MKQIACPANTLLEATGGHVLLQTQSDSLILAITHTHFPQLALSDVVCPHRHTITLSENMRQKMSILICN